MTTNEKIAKVREKMAENKIDAVIIPSADPHMSEYFSDHWKTRAWLSGFTNRSPACGQMGATMCRQKDSLQAAKVSFLK